MVAIGIMLGLGAAAGQSLSYLFSRLYVLRSSGAVVRLLILGHVFMGVMSLAILPMLPLKHLPPLSTYAWPLAAATGFYLLGQVGMFVALRYTEASRASPLLGLKIAILAVVSSFYFHHNISPVQWLAVVAAVIAALMLRTSGGQMSGKTVAAITLACIAYSISDINITALVLSLRALGPVASTMTAVVFCYLISGALGLALLPWAGRPNGHDWRYALPWAASWFGAMLLLFACFGSIGVVFGNIVQSTRGLISLGLGVLISVAGHVHLEKKVPASVWLKRGIATLLMCGAVALYIWGKPK